MENNGVIPMTQQVSVSQSAHAPQAYFPTESDWKMMLSWGASALKSGMLPSAIRSPEAAAIVALKGRELGIPFMVAIAHIHVINGKPSMSAEMMQSLARRNLPGLIINIGQSTSEIAEVELIRPEKGAKPYLCKFSMEDAKKANLLGKDVWKQYPAAMLWSRAISAGLRKVCPEALMGVSYTPEELGAEVAEDGNVIETTGKRVENDKPPLSPSQPEIDQALKHRRGSIWNMWKSGKGTQEGFQRYIFHQFKAMSGGDLTPENLTAIEHYISTQLNDKPPQPLDPAIAIVEQVVSSDPDAFDNFSGAVV